jgi:hypothetical protein
VKLVQKIFILGFVAFWAVITNHCSLELVPGLDFLACSPQTEATPHQPSDCGDDDACATIESGLYKSEQRQVSAGKAPFLSVAYTLALLAHAVAFEPAASRVPEHSPPELVHTWQFLSRAALPPRAPSFLS